MFDLQEFTSKKNVAQHIRDVHTDHYFKCNDCHKVLIFITTIHSYFITTFPFHYIFLLPTTSYRILQPKVI